MKQGEITAVLLTALKKTVMLACIWTFKNQFGMMIDIAEIDILH